MYDVRTHDAPREDDVFFSLKLGLVERVTTYRQYGEA